MLIEQIIEFELKGPGLPAVHALPQLIIFMTKQTSLSGSVILPIYCRRHCTLLSPTWAKSLTKFNPKMQEFKRVLD